MSGNVHEAALRHALHAAMSAGRIREAGDASPYFAQLAQAYPADGSKIDWRRVPDAIVKFEDDHALQPGACIAFFDEMRAQHGLAGELVYLGDSATDFALAGPAAGMREALPALLVIPQHHYILGPEAAWCMCFTMEGDMGFGFRSPGPDSDQATRQGF